MKKRWNNNFLEKKYFADAWAWRPIWSTANPDIADLDIVDLDTAETLNITASSWWIKFLPQLYSIFPKEIPTIYFSRDVAADGESHVSRFHCNRGS